MDIQTPRKVAKKSVPATMGKSPIPAKEATAKPNHQPLSQETVQSLQELGDVFRQIHRRLVSEGYIIRNGKIFKPGSDDTDNGAK